MSITAIANNFEVENYQAQVIDRINQKEAAKQWKDSEEDEVKVWGVCEILRDKTIQQYI